MLSLLLAVHSLVELLGKLLSLGKLLLKSLLHLGDVPTLHISFPSERHKSFLLHVGVSRLHRPILTLSSGAITFIMDLLTLKIVLVMLVLSGSLRHFLSQVADLFNQLNVVLHHVLVVLPMDLIFLFETLLERMVRRFQVLALVDVLLLDIRINFDILNCVIFHVAVERRLNRLLQLIVIIDILNNPVNSIFETLNVDVLRADPGPRSLNDFLHFLLPISVVIYRET